MYDSDHRNGEFMETIFPSLIFLSMIIVFSIDAARKRREFLKKHKSS